MRILVIEDERRMASLLKRGLMEEGHHVALARDGVVGLEIALGSRFDVIVLDMMLPRMDGIAVASRLRAGHNQTPILMLTAKDEATDVIRGLDAGADDYLTKRFRSRSCWRGCAPSADGARSHSPCVLRLPT